MVSQEFKEIPIGQVHPDPQQPRKAFSPESLESLANSIRRFGVLQPVVVREEADGYVLIAGERRWRAAQLAGLDTLPAVVRQLPPSGKDTYLESLSENLQRSDLNPIEKARALKRVQDRMNWTHEEMGRELGMSRAAVTNTLRLLTLSGDVLDLLEGGQLSEGHIRPLVSVQDETLQLSLAKEALQFNWSVRKMETEAKGRSKGKAKTTPATAQEADVPLSPLYRSAAESLEEYFATKVEIRPGKSSNQLVIHFYDDNSLLDILSKFPIEEEL